MSARKQPPEFATEAEEARWYFDHQDEIEEYLEPAPDTDAPLDVQLGLPPRQGTNAAEVHLRMPVPDVERARRLAARKGLGYQTYIRMLLHEALEQEEALMGRGAPG